MNIGLKLWSTNRNYLAPARELYERGVYQYIELFCIPGSGEMIPLWREPGIPMVLHAPHTAAGLNPALPDRLERNLGLVDEVTAFIDALNPRCVVFHPGVDGDPRETARQFTAFAKRQPALGPLALVENKPTVGLRGEQCRGDTPEEIAWIMGETGFGCCLDFGHACAHAAKLGVDSWEVIERFLALEPRLFHLSDGEASSVQDQHMHLGQGNLDVGRFLAALPADAWVSIETVKDSENDLEDFVRDGEAARQLVRKRRPDPFERTPGAKQAKHGNMKLETGYETAQS